MEVDEKGGKTVKTDKIDEGLYSRQLYVLGHEAQQRITSSKILIVGLGGLGVEIAKNVILAGAREVVLYDTEVTALSDLGSQFYLTESDVNKNRAEACHLKLAELNEYVSVSVLDSKISLLNMDLLKSFTVCVVTTNDLPLKRQIELNDICHKLDVKFISCEVAGLFCRCFCDFGEKFIVKDTDGEPPAVRLVTSISNETSGVVTVNEDERHGLEDGDYVRFREIQGMTELNSLEPVQIKVTGPFSFTISDTTNFGTYSVSSGGYIEQVKMPKTLNFKPLSKALSDPGEFLITDFAKFDRSGILHTAFQALYTFQAKYGSFPEVANIAQCEEVYQSFLDLSDNNTDMEVKKVILLLASGCSSVLNPLCAFLGGVVGQEVLKACSGKFTPLFQFLYFDALECLPQYLNNKFELSDSELVGYFKSLAKDFGSSEVTKGKYARYSNEVAVFGSDFVTQLTELNLFLVGAGAIGCEMLKNWALMGVASNYSGHITVTDMDVIEKSNLNRQFLFRPKNVGQSKSVAAGAAALEINSSVKITSFEDKVGEETEKTFSDEFWSKLDIVCTALDNVEARLYVDNKCVQHGKPLLESGTLGTKGNTQVVVPNLTENYGASRDPPEKSIPICTLKNFPNKIEHTLQWARDLFEGIFTQDVQNVNGYISSPEFILKLDQQPNTKLATIKKLHELLVSKRARSFEDCVKWARMEFEQQFSNQIKQLLHNFPSGMLTTTGLPFWSGTKREPTPLVFDVDDETHMSFIISAANLRAFNFNLKAQYDANVFKKILEKVKVTEFVPVNVKIATTEAELEQENEKQDEAEQNAEEQIESQEVKLVKELPKRSELAGFKLSVVDFEKDDDTNFHMEFITAAANLRARNYAITEVDRHQAKLIAGKIIPAIATTTALVTGLICLELYKLVSGKKDIESYKNGFANLALPFFAFSEPIKCAKTKAGEWEWSVWDRIEIDATKRDYTLSEFRDEITKRYNVEVSMLSYGSIIIDSMFTAAAKRSERSKMEMKKLVESIGKKLIEGNVKVLTFEVCCSDEEGEDVDLPSIQYKIR